MRTIDPNRLENFVDELAPLFYVLMLVSLLAILVGSTGSGALLLILGAGVHIVRGAYEELAVRERRRAARLKPVTGASRSRAPQRSRRPANGALWSARTSARRVADPQKIV